MKRSTLAIGIGIVAVGGAALWYFLRRKTVVPAPVIVTAPTIMQVVQPIQPLMGPKTTAVVGSLSTALQAASASLLPAAGSTPLTSFPPAQTPKVVAATGPITSSTTIPQ